MKYFIADIKIKDIDMRQRLFLIVVIALLFFPGEVFAKTIRFGLHWQPQSQFAGYIIAKEKGFFAEDSLDVELVFTEGADLILNRLINNEFNYATAWLSQAIYTNQNEEIVNIAQILQRSSLMLVAKKSSKIYDISDLNHKNVSLWEGDFTIPLNAFLNKHKLVINRLPGKPNIDLFMSEICDAASIMYYNEYNKLYLAGLEHNELTIFKFYDDDDLDFVEDGVYTKKSYLHNNQDEVIKVRQAVLKGWLYAYRNREETVKIVLDYCNKKKLRTNYAEQKWMLDKFCEALFDSDINEDDLDTEHLKEFGILLESDYMKIVNELKKQQMIDKATPFKKFDAGLKND